MKDYPNSESRPYKIWKDMKLRCYNKNNKRYKCYGRRGIIVCDEWRNSFKQFWYDMKDTYQDHLQIDRIDNNGNYTKENCRWVTREENSRNKSNSKMITINEETKCASEWAEIKGINKFTVLSRIARKSKCNLLDPPLKKKKKYFI